MKVCVGFPVLLAACAVREPLRRWDLDPTLDPVTVTCSPAYEIPGLPSVLSTEVNDHPEARGARAQATATCWPGEVMCDGQGRVTKVSFDPPQFHFECPAEDLTREAESAWAQGTYLSIRHELGHAAACLAYQEQVREAAEATLDCAATRAARDALFADLVPLNRAFDRRWPTWLRERRAARSPGE